MLVSKTKPCMCKCIPLDGKTANGSLEQLLFARNDIHLDNCGNARANTRHDASGHGFGTGARLLVQSVGSVESSVALNFAS